MILSVRPLKSPVLTCFVLQHHRIHSTHKEWSDDEPMMMDFDTHSGCKRDGGMQPEDRIPITTIAG